MDYFQTCVSIETTISKSSGHVESDELVDSNNKKYAKKVGEDSG